VLIPSWTSDAGFDELYKSAWVSTDWKGKRHWEFYRTDTLPGANFDYPSPAVFLLVIIVRNYSCQDYLDNFAFALSP